MSWISEKLSGIYSGKNKNIREVLAEIQPSDQGESLYGVQYIPDEDNILYHYCDSNAFLSIVQNKELWFSDVFAMNDFSEMHWGYGIWEISAGQLLSEIPKTFIDKIDELIHESGKYTLPLICCFSKDGDVLSQWRAYANDGHGYAVGFSAKELANLPSRALQVMYNKNEQIHFAKSWIRAIYDVEKEEGFKFGEDFFTACTSFALDICALKNPGFREELEIRYVHALNIIEENGLRRFKDLGGTAFGKSVPGIDVSFRMRQSIPVVYLKQKYDNEGKCSPIKRVVLGPKNQARETGISLFLETYGIRNVEIIRSETSYA